MPEGGEGRRGEVSWRLKDVDRSQVSREIGTLSLSAFSELLQSIG